MDHSAYTGVAARYFWTGTTAGWNSSCANGQLIHSQDVWANTALKMYPSYTGPRPNMLIIHGSADTVIYPQNVNETVKQWADVFVYTYRSPQQTLPGNPSSEYTEYVYGPNLVGVYGTGVSHNVPVNGTQDLEWFGITGSDVPVTTTSVQGPTTTLVTSATSRTSSVVMTTTTAPALGGCTATRWGQCGGIGWSGCTVCAAPYSCVFSNNWYSQCLWRG